MEKYVDEKVVAQLTGIKLPTLRNHRFLGKGLPYCKIGRSVRYSITDIVQYMESHKVSTENWK